MQRDVNEIGDRIIIAPTDVMIRMLKITLPIYLVITAIQIMDHIARLNHPPHPGSTQSPIFALVIYVIGFVSFSGLLYEKAIRPPRIELTQAGITKFSPFSRRQFWPWTVVGTFHRGSRPGCIEAPRTDDPSSFVYLPEWILNENRTLITILNDYHANRVSCYSQGERKTL